VALEGDGFEYGPINSAVVTVLSSTLGSGMGDTFEAKGEL
jgi:hypothetical protein